MSEECRAWALGRFGNILGCFRKDLRVLVKQVIKRFGRVFLIFFWNY